MDEVLVELNKARLVDCLEMALQAQFCGSSFLLLFTARSVLLTIEYRDFYYDNLAGTFMLGLYRDLTQRFNNFILVQLIRKILRLHDLTHKICTISFFG